MESTLRMDTLGTLWNKAWKLYADRFGTVMGIFLLPVVLLGLGSVFQAIGFPLALAGALLSLAGVIFSIIGAAALIYSFKHKADFNDAYRAGGKLFWPLIWVVILVVFAMFGSFVMLVIPGIWLAVVLTFSNYVLVLEGKRGMTALMQSREYVSGYWWAVFGRMVLLVIVLIVASIIVRIPFALAGGAVGQAIASALVILFFTPFSVAYYYSMYENLVALKPHVHGSTPTQGKTFILVSQIVGIVAMAIIISVAASGGFSSSWHYQYNYPNSPGAY